MTNSKFLPIPVVPADGGPVRIPLSRGLFALVDRADVPLVAGHRWRAFRRKKGGEAFYAMCDVKVGGRTKNILMHRLLLNVHGSNLEVDHADRDGLNNTRANIRVCTKSQNNANRVFPNPTGYRGVWRTAWGTFRAGIGHDGCNISLGTFPSSLQAAVAYDDAARRLFREFAILNFPAVETPA